MKEDGTAPVCATRRGCARQGASDTALASGVGIEGIIAYGEGGVLMITSTDEGSGARIKVQTDCLS